jgi:hypothetical protein
MLTCALFAAPAPASIIWSGTQANLASSVEFHASGPDLVVTLTNTSAADVQVPGDVLTGVFFNISGATLLLNPASAVVPATSSVLFGVTEPGGGVGGEWAYRGGLSGAPGNRSYGISSTGLNLFGPPDLFPGINLQGPEGPDGLQYGITSAGDNPATGNTPVTGSNALIQNQVVFTLSGLPAGFDLSRINGVFFQHGTGLSEPGYGGTVPAPAGGLLLLGASGWHMRRRR